MAPVSCRLEKQLLPSIGSKKTKTSRTTI